MQPFAARLELAKARLIAMKQFPYFRAVGQWQLVATLRDTNVGLAFQYGPGDGIWPIGRATLETQRICISVNRLEAAERHILLAIYGF